MSSTSETPPARLRDMTMPQIGARLSSVLFLPVGSIEQHGSHMPVDTDSTIATLISESAAAAVGGLVAPCFAYGCRSLPISGGGELFPGTISLSGQTFSSLVCDLVVTYARHGHRRIVILNGHYENTMFAIEGVKSAQEIEDVEVLVVDWWNILRIDRLVEIFDGQFPGWEAEHAGIIETSLLMHLAPERVIVENIEDRMGEIPPPTYTVLPERPGLVDPSGILRTAWGATPQLGADIFAEVRRTVIDIVTRQFPDAVVRSEPDGSTVR